MNHITAYVTGADGASRGTFFKKISNDVYLLHGSKKCCKNGPNSVRSFMDAANVYRAVDW